VAAFRLDKDEKYAMTTGEDGLMFVYQIDSNNLRKEALFNPFAGIEGVDFMAEYQREDLKNEKTKQFMDNNEPYYPAVDKQQDCINQAILASSVRLTEEVNVDITDPT
jgi:hypothetical protein